MNYRPEVDGLRALAVLPVIFFHAGFELFSGGFVGVDVFFVISGYLITTIIISEMADAKFSIINFYERRARRILPALFFVMAACLPFAFFWLAPNDMKDFGESLIAVSIFSSNILFWLESGYFDTAAELKPLLHTWSLAVEEQYYILFPIFLMLTWRFGIRWIISILFIVFILSLGLAQWGSANNPSATFFLLPTRGWELLIGVFVAFYLTYRTFLSSQIANQLLSFLGLGMIIYSILSFDETTPFPSFYTLLPTMGTGLLILCAIPNTLVYSLLSYKPVVGIGLISYSAYLWHQPLLAFTKYKLLGEVPDMLLFLLCIFSLICGWISWRFVERPFREKLKFTRQHIFSFSIAGISVFLLAGLYLHSTNGALNRYSEDQQRLFGSFIDAHSYVGKRHQSMILKGFDVDQNKKKILIIGDSYAEDLTNALYEAGINTKFNLSGYKIPMKCGVLFVEHKYLEKYIAKGCKSLPNFYNESLLELMVLADEVWLASSWLDFTPQFMRQSLQNLKQYNQNILVFGKKDFGKVSASWFQLNQKKWKTGNQALSAKHFSELEQFNKLLENEVVAEGGRFIDSQKIICDGMTSCANFRDYNLISFDGGHLTPFGAKLFGTNLIEILQQ